MGFAERDAKRLALEFVELLDIRCFADENGAAGMVIGADEVHDLFALRGDRHRADDRIVFVGKQAGDDAVPGGRYQRALDADALGNCLTDRGVETNDLVFFVDEIERRVLTRHGDLQFADGLDVL
ncbi:hypothetical protein D9M72_456190 [compost metagenome]